MRKGFTLIELVMVIVILGILAAVAIPKYMDLSSNAKESAAKGALGGLRSAIAIWYANNAATATTTAWPTTAQIAGAMADGKVPVSPYVTATADNTAIAADTSKAWYYDSANGRIYCSYNTTW